MDAIILVGGLGTRLGPLTKEIPKPMLPIRKKPFLLSLLEHLFKNGFHNVVLATGYKHRVIESFVENLTNKDKIPNIILSREENKLGTGGAIINAMNKIQSDHFYVLNGDTFIDLNFEEFFKFHIAKKSNISICGNLIKNGDRYGSIKFDKAFKLIEMNDSNTRNNYINAGSYILDREFMISLKESLPENFFSFEDEILKKMCKKIEIFCFLTSTFFLDIGVPEDYKIAQKILFNE